MKKYTTLLAATVLGAATANAATIVQTGDPVVDRGATDGWAGLFHNVEAIAAPNPGETIGTITDVSFWVNVGGRADMEIVPLLLETSGGSTSVIGIGETLSGYTTVDVTVNEAFVLAAGTDTFDTATPGSTYHIGFGSWNPDGNTRLDDGLIAYDGTGGSPGWSASNEGETVAVNDVIAGVVGSTRIYSYQNTVSFVPEASGTALVLLAGMVGISRRRRR